jgi:glucose-1-phosphate thymidylyltransferase
MKCLILAAGYATRLYPLTENYPKPLLEVGGKTIVDWLVDDLVEDGRVDAFAVVTNHKFAPHFENWTANRLMYFLEHQDSEGEDVQMPGIAVVDDGTETNETRLGAVRDIQFALDELGWDDDLLVIAGDNVLDFSLSRFLDYAQEKGTSCIMRYFEQDTARLRKSGIVEIDGDGLITGMEEKPAEPKSNWCCPPFYFYVREDARRFAEGIAAGCGTDAPGSFVAWLSGQTRVHAMEMPGKRFDIGNLESYRNVCGNYRGIIE